MRCGIRIRVVELLEELLTQHDNVARSANAELDAIAVNAQDRHGNVVAEAEALLGTTA